MPRLRNILPVLITLLTGAGLSAHALDLDAATVSEQVRSHVLGQLRQHHGVQGDERVIVDILNVPGAPFKIEQAQAPSDIVIDTRSSLAEVYANRAIVRVSLKTHGGQSLREFGVPVQIKIEKPVWVVKNLIQAGEPMSAKNLTLETREISRSYQHTVGRDTRLTQYEARVNLQPGELLDNRKLLIPPDVRRFTDIRIVLSNGKGMEVSVPGTALSDGRVGETIQVRQQSLAKKTFSGEVIDKNRVLVQI